VKPDRRRSWNDRAWLSGCPSAPYRLGRGAPVTGRTTHKTHESRRRVVRDSERSTVAAGKRPASGRIATPAVSLPSGCWLGSLPTGRETGIC